MHQWIAYLWNSQINTFHPQWTRARARAHTHTHTHNRHWLTNIIQWLWSIPMAPVRLSVWKQNYSPHPHASSYFSLQLWAHDMFTWSCLFKGPAGITTQTGFCGQISTEGRKSTTFLWSKRCCANAQAGNHEHRASHSRLYRRHRKKKVWMIVTMVQAIHVETIYWI